jgi:hypothetical protein
MDSFYKKITLSTNNNNILVVICDIYTIYTCCIIRLLGIMSHVEVSAIYKKTTNFNKKYDTIVKVVYKFRQNNDEYKRDL